MTYKVSELTLEAWLKAARAFNDYTYTHYWEYARAAAERVGAVSKHIAILTEDGEVAGLCDVRIRNLPFSLGGIAYISGGPMVDRGQESMEKNLPHVLNALKKHYNRDMGLILRLTQRQKPDDTRRKEEEIYLNCGFTIHGGTDATFLLDLSPGIEQIRKGLRRTWRQQLNKSERQGLRIVTREDAGLSDEFVKLYDDLRDMKEFDVDMDSRFFAHIQKISPEQERFHVAIAYNNDKPVGGLISSMTGDTSVCLLAATNEYGRNVGAGFLLQWHLVEESIRRGCHWYDLGGIDKNGNPHVYRFKQGMGGAETEIGKIFQSSKGLKSRLSLGLEAVYKVAKKN